MQTTQGPLDQWPYYCTIVVSVTLFGRCLERLKARNERLSAALDRRKGESEQISMALSQHEADSTALQMALRYWYSKHNKDKNTVPVNYTNQYGHCS